MSGAELHLHDEELVSLYLSREADQTGPMAHVACCPPCARRLWELTDLFDAVRDDGLTESDEVFDLERLARQRDQILKRLDPAGRPARVLEFPVFRSHPLERGTPHVATRWVAAAAAAGLLVGVGTGVLFDFRASRSTWFDTAAVRLGQVKSSETIASRETGRRRTSDDELMTEIDRALQVVRPPELQAIDALTPRSVEPSSRVW